MGVQAPAALLEDERVPVAGGTYGLCHQRGGGRGGNSGRTAVPAVVDEMTVVGYWC